MKECPCAPGTRSPPILHSQVHFGSKKILSTQNFLVQKNVTSEIFLCPIKFWANKNFGSQNILGPKEMFHSKNMLGPRNMVQKLGSKKCLTRPVWFNQSKINLAYPDIIFDPNLLNLSWPDLTSPDMSWHVLTWSVLTWPVLTWPVLTWPDLTWPVVTWTVLTWLVLTWPVSRYKGSLLGTLGAGCRCKFLLNFFFYPSKAWILWKGTCVLCLDHPGEY